MRGEKDQEEEEEEKYIRSVRREDEDADPRVEGGELNVLGVVLVDDNNVESDRGENDGHSVKESVIELLEIRRARKEVEGGNG